MDAVRLLFAIGKFYGNDVPRITINVTVPNKVSLDRLKGFYGFLDTELRRYEFLELSCVKVS